MKKLILIKGFVYLLSLLFVFLCGWLASLFFSTQSDLTLVSHSNATLTVRVEFPSGRLQVVSDLRPGAAYKMDKGRMGEGTLRVSVNDGPVKEIGYVVEGGLPAILCVDEGNAYFSYGLK